MNKFIVLIAALSMGALPLYADDSHQSEKQQNAAAKSAEQTMKSDQQTKLGWEIMIKMQEQMEKIKATQDPAERQKLMQEHMRDMDEGMKILSGLGKDGGDMTNNKMMKFRMDMMTTMMEQMMQREKVRDTLSSK